MILFFIVYSIFIIWYSGHYVKGNNINFTLYKVFFQPLGILLPIIISVYAGLTSLIERNANNFQNFIGSPFGKVRVFFSKKILLTLNLFISIFLSMLLFLVGVNLVYGINLPLKKFLIGTIMIYLGSIALICIYTAGSLVCSIGALICIGLFGSLVSSILSVTALGDKIWWLVPFTYPIVLSIMPFYLEILSNLQVYLLFLPTTLLIVIFSVFWVKKWEGR